MRMHVAMSQRSNGVKIWSLAFTICTDLSYIVSLLVQDNGINGAADALPGIEIRY